MATATKKKGTGKKSGAKKTTKAKVEKAASTRPRHDREALMPQVVELRDEGELGWEKIASELGIDPGLARLLYMTAKVKPKDRIKGDDETIAEGIVEARDELKQSWGLIAARARLPESRVRRIYQETTGNSHQQGYKVVQERTAAKREAAGETKKASAKKSSAEKSSTAKAKKAAVTKNRKKKGGSGNPSKG